MDKKMVFTEAVLSYDHKDTLDTIEYLRKKRYELIAISKKDSLPISFQKELLNYFKNTYSEVVIRSFFFEQMRDRMSWNCLHDINSNLRVRKYSTRDCIFVDDDISSCSIAQKQGWQSFYYDDGAKDVIGGRKIKALSDLKRFY